MSVNAPPHLHRPGLSLSELTEPDFAARVEKRYGPLPPGLADDPGLRERYRGRDARQFPVGGGSGGE
ncbi:hypothetical protein OG762_47605 (plasmid) [Streptomyces sp. NBC_01136]|uniref:hypothetical protein n=1 Tax=unclassified Streptomyces TaxID=2593676 RepID=UPI002F90C635|nr:hypothetical protein OG762_47605 [Streptomyces sp. NBC_01136]